MNAKNSIRKFWNRNSNTIISVTGAILSVAAVGMAIKETPKAIQLYKKAEEEGHTKAGCIVKAVPGYFGTIALEIGALTCMSTSHRRTRAQYFSAVWALASAEDYILKLENHIRETNGEEGLLEVRKTLIHDHPGYHASDDPNVKLYYLQYGPNREGQYFEATPEDVWDAKYHFNRYFILKGDATLNDLLRFFTLKEEPYGDDYGWSELIGQMDYGYQWVDFVDTEVVLDDGLECIYIYMPFDAHDDYMD